MSVATKTVAPAHELMAAYLNEKRIRRVLIVDDSFDPPARADLELEELAEFWGELDPDLDEQKEALKRLFGSVPASDLEIDDEGVASLYAQRETLGALQDAFDRRLRVPLERKHAMLDGFTSDLRDKLGLEVHTRGKNDGTSPGPVDIIFLDYYLGKPKDEGSVGAARDTVRRLLQFYPVGDEKPLVVLMSSYEDVKGLSEDFRGQTGIIGGMFYFVPKSDLGHSVKLLLNLDMLAAALPAGHRIQRFIDAVEDNAESIKSQFLAAIKRLNLDDYVYIQRLSLQADGHPLGDYLLWLYSAYFGHLLFELGLGGERRDLDKISFSDWMPSHSTPSKQLTAMYHAALFDTTVGPLGGHPRRNSATGQDAGGQGDQPPASDESPSLEARPTVPRATPGGSQERAPSTTPEPVLKPVTLQSDNGPGAIGGGPSGRPSAVGPPPVADAKEAARDLRYFNLGDIFLNDATSRLLMVSNPACDLEFAPDDKRLLDPDDSIVFIPGLLEKHGGAAPSQGLRTELFEWDGESYYVLWQTKRVTAVAHREAGDWLDRNGFSRVARLRVPFCLEVQQRFAADLTRVGVPVPPPFYRPLRVTIYERGPDGSAAIAALGDADTDAFVIQTGRAGDKCSLTAGLVRALQSRIDELARADLLPLDDRSLGNEEITRRQRTNKRTERAKRSSEDFIAWREARAPFPLPTEGKPKSFAGAGVSVTCDAPKVGQLQGDALLMVHISELLPDEATAVERVPHLDTAGPAAEPGPALVDGRAEGTQSELNDPGGEVRAAQPTHEPSGTEGNGGNAV